MNIIHDRAREGGAEGIVVIADRQSSGRGRSGNIWIAPEGNLYCSLLLRPQIHAKDAGQYSFITAVSLARVFQNYISAPHIFQHKWPNDVLINQKKGAGILLESDINSDGTLGYLNIGVGVNIRNAPEDRISLHDVSDIDISRDDFLNEFLKHMSDVISLYNDHGFVHIRDEWLRYAYGINEPISVRMPNETLYGIFKNIDDDGSLLLEIPDKTIKNIYSGEVFFGWDKQQTQTKGVSYASGC